jgi:hypothetical protein
MKRNIRFAVITTIISITIALLLSGCKWVVRSEYKRGIFLSEQYTLIDWTLWRTSCIPGYCLSAEWNSDVWNDPVWNKP